MSKSISQLTESTELANEDLIHISDASVANLSDKDRKIKWSNVLAAIGGSSAIDSNFTAWNSVSTYTGGATYYVSYLSRLYLFVKATDSLNETPGTDEAIWQTQNASAHIIISDSTTDNKLLKSKGTTGSELEETGISIDDNDEVSGASKFVTDSYALTSSATIAIDLDDGDTFDVDLAHTTTITASNFVDNQNFTLYLVMDATGGYTVTLDSFDFIPFDNGVSIDNTANAVNVIFGVVYGGQIYYDVKVKV